MTLDQDETMAHLQRLMSATLEINEVLVSHAEAIAMLLATHKNRPMWVDDLRRASDGLAACVQRSTEIQREKARSYDRAAVHALIRDAREANRLDRELVAKAKRGALSEEEKRQLLKDLLK